MKKRWVLKDSIDADTVSQLADTLDVNEIIAKLLVIRKITDYDTAKQYFRPQLESLHSPFLLKDMDIAVDRIEKAIKDNEKILIYGDYDVDGTTAVALVYTFLKTQYDQIEYYIPDRYNEGYGVSHQGVNFANDNGFSLIIALDCGIKATEKVKYAKEKGIDFIICDHHQPDNELPPAVAILNPKQDDCDYPFDELSGCGIGFKLIQAYSEKHDIPFDELDQYLDLVAASIASDIVPIVGENRVLEYYGLKRINTYPRIGIKAMLKIAEHNREINVSDLVFVIGPRINAAGRVEHGKQAVELLIAEDKEVAMEKAISINESNLHRRSLDEHATRQAIEMIEKDEKLVNAKTTVLFNEEWHKGVVGIVASRVMEFYYRPSIILTGSNGVITGSARSVRKFDVYQAIEQCGDLLEQFGGHKYAAGLTLKQENLIAFQNRFEQVVSQTIDEDMLIHEIAIDDEILISDITPKLYRIIKQFSPFGPGNMRPVFLTKGIIDSGFCKIVGKNHLKMTVLHPDNPKYKIPVIAFNQGEHIEHISQGKPFDLVYSIGENRWNGEVIMQLRVKDIKKL